MFNISREQDGVFCIDFESWFFPDDSFDPIFPFAKTAAKLSDAKLRIVENFFEYEIECEDFGVLLCWNSGFSLMAYVKREKKDELAFAVLKKTCEFFNGKSHFFS